MGMIVSQRYFPSGWLGAYGRAIASWKFVSAGQPDLSLRAKSQVFLPRFGVAIFLWLIEKTGKRGKPSHFPWQRQ